MTELTRFQIEGLYYDLVTESRRGLPGPLAMGATFPRDYIGPSISSNACYCWAQTADDEAREASRLLPTPGPIERMFASILRAAGGG